MPSVPQPLLATGSGRLPRSHKVAPLSHNTHPPSASCWFLCLPYPILSDQAQWSGYQVGSCLYVLCILACLPPIFHPTRAIEGETPHLLHQSAVVPKVQIFASYAGLCWELHRPSAWWLWPNVHFRSPRSALPRVVTWDQSWQWFAGSGGWHADAPAVPSAGGRGADGHSHGPSSSS